MMRQTMAAAQQQGGGGGGAAVYVEEDFTLTTTGNLTTNNLAVDELGGGWLGDPASFNYLADGSGVRSAATNTRSVVVETAGREDVQVTLLAVIERRGTGLQKWNGIVVRATGSGHTDGLSVTFSGGTTDPDLTLYDGDVDSTVLKTWDLSALLTTQPVEKDTVSLVMVCDGDNITLYSVAVNGGPVEVVDDTYTLTGAVATAHGAGSGADWYGLQGGRSYPDITKYFKVETIPA